MGGSKTHIVHSIIIGLIRLILCVTFIYTLKSNHPIIQVVSVIAFCFTFLPKILKNLFGIDLPMSLEVLYLMLIYGILNFGELRGLFSGVWWWSILTTFTASVALGFISLSVVHVLLKKSRISANPIFAGFLIFSFTITLGVFWEIFEFALDLLIHSGLQKGLMDTMQDICVNILGAFAVSIVGAFYLKQGKDYLVSTFLSGIIERNLWKVGDKKVAKNPQMRLLDLINEGENDRTEFKSSFRTNLHTNEFDKRMELGILKTVAAFLNTKGGNLLVGVSDDGNVLGLENDKFQNNDKLSLHFTNLIKSHIGNEFLPFIRLQIMQLKDKQLVIINCKESKKRVFLKNENTEEFYVRNGSASIKLSGGSLVDYIQHKF
ncbi:ATP-binding protein [Candidatus Pacearchaeota archaeon]|nr:ATP-binding protein [Candidatus Pacearchaeota archaeon]